MNSREKLIKTINHNDPKSVLLDIGATPQTGISASVLYHLRKSLGLDDKPSKVYEPFQILGEVEMDMMEKLSIDVVGIFNPYNMVGVKNENYRPWNMPDGTPCMISGNIEYDEVDGKTFVYPQGDRSCKASMVLPEGGYFFDATDRFDPIVESDLDAKRDFKNDFVVYSDEIALSLQKQADHYHKNTDLGIVGNFQGMGLGDAGGMPGVGLKKPIGIRKMDDWLMAHMLWPDYINDLFEMQTEVALKNLEIYKQAVGDKIQAITVSGTDFGTQSCEIFSPDLFRKFYKPYYTKVNNWIHENTNWKTFFHTCGSIANILDDLHECGVDILNPVQCSATGMEAEKLKKKYGDKFVFWGGGVDTQATLPFGTPDQVYDEVKGRIKIFNQDGGFVFSAIHNIVGKTPIDNLKAMFRAIEDSK